MTLQMDLMESVEMVSWSSMVPGRLDKLSASPFFNPDLYEVKFCQTGNLSLSCCV